MSDLEKKLAALEALLFIHGEPVTYKKIESVLAIEKEEAEKLLGRKPDVLVLNGLEISRFPTFEETSIKHITSREKLRSAITGFLGLVSTSTTGAKSWSIPPARNSRANSAPTLRASSASFVCPSARIGGTSVNPCDARSRATRPPS